MALPYPLHTILFLDIETVPQFPDYDSVPVDWKKLWDLKSSYLIRNKEEENAATIYNRAGIYAEFGKIICITCGVVQDQGSDRKMILKSFFGDDEKIILARFSDMLSKWSSGESRYLCAHNGKEFDFPYLCRRMIVHQLPIPGILQIAGKKPWEIGHLDTMELWKFGDFKSYTSLNLLAHTLGVPTPKDDIDGSMVWEVYYREKNITRIVEYCQKDVLTVARVFLRLYGEKTIGAENIEIKNT